MKGRHYTVVEDDVIDDERLSAMALLVYIALRRHMNANGECWPKQSRIAKMARCSVRTVSTALLELREYGYVTVQSGAVAGKSNTYVLMEGKQQLPTPSAAVADQGKQQLPTEVSSERSNLKEESPVATLPAVVKKAKHTPEQIAIFHTLSTVFYQRSGKWQHGPKEATALYKIIDYARERPEFPALLVEAFWKLHTGELYGMTEGEKRWWASIPYVPSRLDAKAVEAMMERVEDGNRVSPEFLAQLEKDYGAKIRKRQALEAK